MQSKYPESLYKCPCLVTDSVACLLLSQTVGYVRAEEGSGPRVHGLTIRSKPDCYLKLVLLRTKKPPKQHA